MSPIYCAPPTSVCAQAREFCQSIKQGGQGATQSDCEIVRDCEFPQVAHRMNSAAAIENVLETGAYKS